MFFCCCFFFIVRQSNKLDAICRKWAFNNKTSDKKKNERLKSSQIDRKDGSQKGNYYGSDRIGGIRWENRKQHYEHYVYVSIGYTAWWRGLEG